MPSPFPGMNPYLELADAWHDFHERVLPLVAERLGAQVQPDYIVKIDEHLFVHELPALAKWSLGPAEVRRPAVDVERLAYVEIRDRRKRTLVRVIELLSPSNKRPGPDREQYLAKRGQVLGSSAHLVEIDLLRGGPPLPADDRPSCDYSVMVSRAERRPLAEFWPIGLREPLPSIPIPLRPPDPDARLDLQAILHHLYDAAGYAYYIYEGAPEPSLPVADAEWARPYLP